MKVFKYIMGLGCSLVFVNSYAAATVESDLEKLSYSMGVFLGQSVSLQETKLDIPSFIQAVEDVLTGKKLKLEKFEIQKIISDYQKKERENMLALADNNKRDGEKFLEENKKKEGVIQTESGLQYTVIKEGNGKKPTEEDTVVVHYKGTLIDGTEFDSSYRRGTPAEFGVNRVIKGFQEALLMMPVGSKWEIVVPSDIAYGERGAGEKIGSNATLLFDIELIAIK